MKRSEQHWCWVGPRQRVQRLGTAAKCTYCNRYKSKHKCGVITDAATAWRDYPVTDCTACCPGMREGAFSTGPLPFVPVVEPDGPEPGDVVRTEKETATKRRDSSRKRSKRMLLIGLAVSSGVDTSAKIRQLLTLFQLEATRESVNRDLAKLVQDRWLTRHKVVREKSQHWQKGFRYRYTISPTLVAKFTEVLSGRSRTDSDP